MKHFVCSLDELPCGSVRSVTAGPVAIMVARTPDGRLYALRDTCPHYGARLSRGTLKPMVEGGDVGEYRVLDDRYIVPCPWHGYEFELESGRCPADPENVRVRAYPVAVEDGSVVVQR